jgi:hypothetical protein
MVMGIIGYSIVFFSPRAMKLAVEIGRKPYTVPQSKHFVIKLRLRDFPDCC